MNFSILTIDAVVAALFAYFITEFSSNYFKVSISERKKALFIVIFSLTNSIIALLLTDINSKYNFAKPILLFIVGIAFMKIILKTNTLQSLFAFSLLVIGLLLGNVIASTIFISLKVNAINNNFMLYLIINLSTCIVEYIYIKILLKYLEKFTETIKNYKSIVIALLLTVALIIITASVFFYSVKNNIVVSIILSCIITIYSIFLYWYLKSVFYTRMQENEKEQQILYNKSLQETLNELRGLKHDFNNMLGVLQNMLERERYKEASEYLKELIGLNDKIGSTAIYNIKNAGLYGILALKIQTAAKTGIKVETVVIGIIEEIPAISVLDLCKIIGILLDNAIEAVESETEKLITVKVISSIEFINIEITNTCSRPLDISKIFTKGYSTKGSDRGNGLYIVKVILDKYKNVLLNTNQDGEFFTQELALKGM